MRRFIGRALLTASLAMLPFMTPAFAQEAAPEQPVAAADEHDEAWVDGTHYFEEEARRLAETETRESLAEFDLRTKGIVQYADRKPLQVGDVLNFTIFNIASKKNEQIAAVLKRIGKHCYIWVERGRTVSNAAIERTARTFDEKIYPTNRAYFGAEWNPGIDGDPRIYLLFLDVRDGYNPSAGRGGFVAGYFNAGDCYPRAKSAGSNEKEIIYLDINPGNPDKPNYLSVLAHEFQHMIHWYHDAKEFTWVNESMSQLASYLNGFNHPSQVLAFMQGGDNNMLSWSSDNMLANYGQVYLFSYYVMKTFAQTVKEQATVTRYVVESDQNGSRGYLAALKKINENPQFKNIFRDFCVTNFLNDPNSAKGRYSYYPQLQKFLLRPMKHHNEPPFSGKGKVCSWSARAVKMNFAPFEGKVRVKFQGQKQVGDRYTNEFDVAAVFLDSKRKTPPTVEWLPVKNFAVDCILNNLAGRHDTLMLVVV
ncbi:MAG TPA: hypothetical protein PKO06_14810, partial [Candidatus Ozemobacteraceae bacterium]|nr:hypothetical protein [Candidatus Ozemobacteraceae bacterium]